MYTGLFQFSLGSEVVKIVGFPFHIIKCPMCVMDFSQGNSLVVWERTADCTDGLSTFRYSNRISHSIGTTFPV